MGLKNLRTEFLKLQTELDKKRAKALEEYNQEMTRINKVAGGEGQWRRKENIMMRRRSERRHTRYNPLESFPAHVLAFEKRSIL